MITANGIEIYHEFHGVGPPLLMISGTGNDLRYSQPERHPINKQFEVLHFDQRGLGQTDTPPGNWEMADYADDAAALIRAVGWDRCHVVGTSFGGMVAQHLAIRHPELIDRLVLNCTSPGGSKPSFGLHSIVDLDPEAHLEMMLGLLDSRWDPGADEPIPNLGAFYDAYIEGSRRPKSEETEAGRRSQLDARSRHDARPKLASISAPTLICAGEFDDLAPVVNSEMLAAGIPNAQLQVFDGGHFFMLQDRSSIPAMLSFLNDTDDPTHDD